MKDKSNEINKLIIGVVLIIAFVFSYLFFINYSSHHQDVVVNGQIDLMATDEDLIYLDGSWEFYPDLLIDPNDNFDDYQDKVKYFLVPRKFSSSDVKEYDYGTYRVNLKLDNGPYAIRFKIVKKAYTLYANGEAIINHGVPADNKEDMVDESQFRVANVVVTDNNLELVMQVSNFSYNKGGVFSSVIFGNPGKVYNKLLIDKLAEALVSGALLVIGAYFMFLYWKRKDALFLKSYSQMSMSLSGIIAVSSEQVLRDIIPMSINARYTLQIVYFTFFIHSLLSFVTTVFSQYTNKKLVKYIKLFLWGQLLLMVHMPFYLKFSILFVLIYFFIFIYILSILWRTLVSRSKGYIMSVYFTAILLISSSIIVFRAMFVFDLGYSIQFLFLAADISALILISDFYRFDYEYVMELQRTIDVANENRDKFIKTFSEFILKPLKTNILEVETLVSENVNFDNFEKFNQLRNKTNDIIRTLNSISRVNLEHDINDYQIETVNINHLIEEVYSDFISNNDLSELTVINDFNLNHHVSVDVEQFKIALYGVLKNAQEHTKTYGEIKIVGEKINDYILINVHDNGNGINKKDLPHVFTPFYKAKSNTKNLGIGLSMAKNIVDNHQGTISIQSNENEGTRVSMAFPLELNFHREADILEPPKVKRQSSDVNLLLISNNNKLIKYLNKAYTNVVRCNYKPDNKEELIRKLNNEDIDVIVFDYTSIDATKEEISNNLSEYVDKQNLPVLLISSQSVMQDILVNREQMITDFMTTPIDYKGLILKINNLYNSKKTVERGIEKEFKYLHSQISPHFLYNTLNTIIGLSYIDGIKTREALSSLSVYLRAKLNIFETELFVDIDDELAVIESYINIEKLRFGDNVEIIYEVDEDINFKVPSLMIQNLVENSFRHAFNTNEPNNVLIIKIYQKENKNCILIEDNGKGMPQEKIDEIFDKSTDGYGLSNTIKRLKLIKGSFIKIESKLNEGTKIRIMLPEVKHD